MVIYLVVLWIGMYSLLFVAVWYGNGGASSNSKELIGRYAFGDD